MEGRQERWRPDHHHAQHDRICHQHTTVEAKKPKRHQFRAAKSNRENATQQHRQQGFACRRVKAKFCIGNKRGRDTILESSSLQSQSKGNKQH